MAKKPKTPQRPKVAPYLPGQPEEQKQAHIARYMNHETGEIDAWPEGYETWTREEQLAHVRLWQEEDAKYVPTAEELEMGKHFAAKQASACGWYQRDPNAD